LSQAIKGSSERLSIAVLTVSDTRTGENDTSGDYLVQALEADGHQTCGRAIVRDDVYQIRAILSAWIADANINAVLITGGTGFSGRDSTPEAVRPLFDKDIEGFGEVFRAISYTEIGSSTVQSRAPARRPGAG
jgi:molybdenum cofactor biosynthesis protein B